MPISTSTWLWTVPQARAKARRTFASQLGLLAAVPDWRFGASSPELWSWLEEDDPDLFARAAAAVQAGRIEPLGGLWVESDAQLPQAETLLRHLLYGTRYFHAISGRWPRTAFLPDTFGFSAGLPTLLAAAGIDLFLTTKLHWNDTTRFPYADFRWIGPDGSAVQAHLFGQAQSGYNAPATLADLRRAVQRYEEERGGGTLLYAFGYGDGGGGPTREQVERLRRYASLPLMPDIRFCSVDELVDRDAELPTVRGPLYLEFHRGTYTSQSWAKWRGRRAEESLVAAEALEAWASEGRTPPYRDLWRPLLRSQFHDIVPGSSIGPVYSALAADHESILSECDERLDASLDRLAPPGPRDCLVLASRSGVGSSPQLVHLDRPQLPQGAKVLQAEEGGGFITQAPALPAFGIAALPLRPAEPPDPFEPVRAEQFDLAARDFALQVTAEGVRSVRIGGHELLRAHAGVRAFRQHPEEFDAWELVAPPRRAPLALEHESPLLVEDGPLRSVVRLRHRTAEGSEVAERVIVDRVAGRVEIALSATLAQRRTVLRYEVPTSLRAEAATSESMFGWELHPTVPNGPAQSAQFEWSAHRFVDLSEAHLGLALLNDSRYGHGAEDATMWTTLWTTPLYPDPRADERPAPARLALLPHLGSWQDAGVLQAAHAFSAGLRTLLRRAGRVAPCGPVAGLPENLRLLAVKAAEDGRGVVLHLGEMWGDRGEALLRPAWPVGEALLVDPVREEALPDQSAADWDKARGELSLRFAPRSLAAIRLLR